MPRFWHEVPTLTDVERMQQSTSAIAFTELTRVAGAREGPSFPGALELNELLGRYVRKIVAASDISGLDPVIKKVHQDRPSEKRRVFLLHQGKHRGD